MSVDGFYNRDELQERLADLDKGESPDEPGTFPRGLIVRIGRYLCGQGCSSMWEERCALDEEYFREFLHFYASTHIEHPSTVTRLHFFTAPVNEVKRCLDPLSTEVDEKALLGLEYLGYLVIRPTSPHTVGETLLRTPDTLRGERCYTHCATGFGQTLAGRRLRVASAPFIGQEETGVCAHSAIWGAMKYLHKYRYYPKVSMPDIALLAAERGQQVRFVRPAEGLSLPATYSVFRDLGFQIHLSSAPEWKLGEDGLPEILYELIESGVPALLGLQLYEPPKQGGKKGRWVGAHEVWVAGHTLKQDGTVGSGDLRRLPDRESYLEYLPASYRAHHFLVNDDGVGPYVPATIQPYDGTELAGAGTRPYELVYHTYGEEAPGDIALPSGSRLIVSDVFGPLPEEVFVKPPEAKRMALHPLLTESGDGLHEWLQSKLSDGAWEGPVQAETSAFFQALRDDRQRYAYRTFLCLSARYREHVVGSEMPAQAKTLYARDLNLPEYVWVTEICDTQALRAGDERPRWVVGEVIVDSTDSLAYRAWTRPMFLAVHAPGLLVWNSSAGTGISWRADEDVELSWESILADNPYPSYSYNADADDAARSHRKLGPPRHA